MRIQPISTYGQRLEQREHGFTLIELLTVIAIIGILAAIIIPVVSKIRESAKYAQGTSNLRELARACIMYANDTKGWFPHEGYQVSPPSATEVKKAGDSSGPWWNEIPPYIGAPTLYELARKRADLPRLGDKSVYICPSTSRTSATRPTNEWVCYAPSLGLSGIKNGKMVSTNLIKVQNPSRTVLFAETTNYVNSVVGSVFANSNPKYLAQKGGCRWKTKSIVSFMDGSVRSFSISQLEEQGDDLAGNKTGVIWDDPNSGP